MDLSHLCMGRARHEALCELPEGAHIKAIIRSRRYRTVIAGV